MCDCFHAVLPAWAGAPGSGTGRELQPEEPEAEADHSVTAGTVSELVRPQPQGSSPVYECVAEGAGSGLPGDAPGGPASSGRRRSWWRRDSGASRAFPRMSSPEDAPEVTLETKAEAGASGYSVAGGGSRGVFVKHVLKGSSAAKLFNLREGDQLLSATIFFDDIKYEDALKILQYSEPYRVQFQIRRKLPARQDEDRLSRGAQRGPAGTEKQLQVAPDGPPGTPAKTLDTDSDQDRLLGRPDQDRGRQPQKERLSWPKFQPRKGRRQPGPRRSRSSSEAQELSPTRPCSEAPLPAGRPPGGRLRSLRLRLGVGRSCAPRGAGGKAARGGEEGARTQLLEDTGLWDEGWGDPRMDSGGWGEGETPGATQATALPGPQQQVAPGGLGTDRGETGQGDTMPGGKTGGAQAPGQGAVSASEGVCELEAGIARLSLQDAHPQVDTAGPMRGSHTDRPQSGAPKTKVAKDRDREAEGGWAALVAGKMQQSEGTEQVGAREPGDVVRGRVDEASTDGKVSIVRLKMPSFGVWTAQHSREGAEEDHKSSHGEWAEHGHQQRRKKQTAQELSIQPPLAEVDDPTVQVTMKLPEGHGPEGDFAQPKMTAVLKDHLPKVKTGRLKMPKVDLKAPQLDIKGPSLDLEGPKMMVSCPDMDMSMARTQVDIQAPGDSLEGDLGLGDTEVTSRDSKFKMPKFKMPSFGVLAPGKTEKASVEVDASRPQGQADISWLPMQEGINAPDLNIKLPSAEVDYLTVQEAKKQPEGHVPEGNFTQPEMSAGLKGHLYKVKTGSLKVDFKLPQVDIKVPSVDLEGPKVMVSCPTEDMSMASSQVDIQAPGISLEGDVGLGDMEETSIDSKFKMPKFKMPSFGVPAPGKTSKASIEVDLSLPKGQTDISLPSIKGEVKAPDLSIKLPSAEMDDPTVPVTTKMPEGYVPKGDFTQLKRGAGLKGHLPKVKTGSLKILKVDFKPGQSDIKHPSVDLESPKVMISCHDEDVSMASSQVDIQAPGVSLEQDVGLGDAEVTSRDSKFKMPKFKMPSFGVSTPGKSGKASVKVDASLPQGQADVSLPSIKGEVKAPDLSIKLPLADVDIPTVQVDVKQPKGQVPEGDFTQPEMGAGLKGHLPEVKISSFKMPKVDFKPGQSDIKSPSVDPEGPKVMISCHDEDVSMASSQVDIQAPGVSLERDVGLGDAEVTSRDSKFKMPKFKMPSFGVSTPGKSGKASVEVDASLPQGQADVSWQGGDKAPDLSIKLPSAEMDNPTVQVEVKLYEGQVPEGEFSQLEMGAGLEGHLPKVKTGSLKMPKVDLKAPELDIRGTSVDLESPKVTVSCPEVDVSVASSQVNIQAPGVSLEGDVSLGDTEVNFRDSKFKMPKFKMPSFGVSTPGKSGEVMVEVDTSLPHAQGEVSLPLMQGDFSIKLPLAEVDIQTVQVARKLSEAPVPEGDFDQPEMGAGLKGHLPKIKTGTFKMPKVDFQVPQSDIKGPSVDLEGPKVTVSCPEVDLSMASTEVDIQALGVSLEGDVGLGDTEVTSRDSRFKMPKFKMPSFGVSTPGNSGKALVEMDASRPKVQADTSLPSFKGDVKVPDLSIKLPSAEVDIPTVQVAVKLPEGHVPKGDVAQPKMGTGLKSHLLKVKTGTLKMPKVDFQVPQSDIKDPSMDLDHPKVTVSCPEVDVSMASSQVDIQAPGVSLEGDVDTEVTSRDSKFKMPKFKMPSFGMSTPGMSGKASVEVDTTLPKFEADISLPSFKGDIKAPDLSIKLPSAEVDVPTVQVSVNLSEGHVPERDVAQPKMGSGLKGHFPKVKTGSLKMPKVDFKAPEVDIKGASVDLEGPKVTVSCPDVDVSMASSQVDIQAPGVLLERDLDLGETQVTSRDSKFKMPKFKMPSFGVSALGKTGKASVEVDTSLPHRQAEVSLPSKQGDISIKLPSAEVDVPTVQVTGKLSEGLVPEELSQLEMGIGLKGHLPKVKTGTIKMPKVDFQVPQSDIKGPSVDLEGPKVTVSCPEVDVSMASTEVDIQAPGISLEGDVGLGDMEVTSRDSKLKTPKIKMPFFGVSTSKSSIDLDASLPQGQADVSWLSMQEGVKAPDLSIKPTSAEVDVPTIQVTMKLLEDHVPKGDFAQPVMGSGLKGHLPKVKTGSLTMPKVDFKPGQSDIKHPSVDLEGPKVTVCCPEVDESVASSQVDIQAPGVSLERDVGLGDVEVTSRDSKFKMPKFKMPSFGVSTPGKSGKASVKVDASLPQGQADVSLPSFKGEVKAPDLSITLPLADVDIPTVQVDVKQPKGQVPEGDFTQPEMGTGLKGHPPEVKTGSLKMPKVDFKPGQSDIKSPSVDPEGPKVTVSCLKVDVSMASSQVDIQAPGVSLEQGMGLGDEEVTSRDSKFKIPKFKMPSFGVSTPGKTGKASVEVDVSLPKFQTDVSLPSIEGVVKTPDLSIKLPFAKMDDPTAQVDVKLPKGQVPKGDFSQPEMGAGLKGHLPEVKTGSLKMPKVGLKASELDIKSASVDLESPMVMVSCPEVDVYMASSEVDKQALGVSLERNMGLGDVEVTSRDSKFKMPKFKMPSFSISGPGKTGKASTEVDASLPQGQADVSWPSMQGSVKSPDLSIELPSAEVDIPTVQVTVKIPEGHMPEGDFAQPEIGAGLMGHLPKVKTGSLKMPKVDLKVPEWDIKGTSMDLEGPKVTVSCSEVDVSMASSQVDIQAPVVSLEGDVGLGDTEVTPRDSKFKMPKFKMPSFGVSTPGKSRKASVEVDASLPKVQADISLPSFKGDVKAPDLSLKLPSAEVYVPTVQVDVNLPKGQVPEGDFTQPEMGTGLKGHPPEVKTGSLKMPKVDFKPGQSDIKSPGVDPEGPKMMVSYPNIDVSMPSSQVDLQAPGISLEGDMGRGDTEVTSRDSKFKIPKFKMPSFGVSGLGKTGKPSVDVDASLPKGQTDIPLPSIKGEVKIPDLSIKLPPAEVDVPTVQVAMKLPEGYVPEGDFAQPEMGAGVKGHLHKVKTDSFKMPKVDFKAPKLDIKGVSVDLEGPKVTVSCPDVDVSMASSQVDIQALGVSLEGDVGLGDTEVTSRDSKFKMPKMKMPSFGVSDPGQTGKALVEMDMSLPHGQADVSLPSMEGDVSINLSSVEVDVPTVQVAMKLPKGHVPEGDFAQPKMRGELKGHLPKVKTGSLKMPKVDFISPQLDIKGASVDLEGPKVTVSCPDVDVSMASSRGNIQAPGVSLEGDLGLGDMEVTSRDSKFKMPKVKMPSFGVSGLGKSGKPSVEVDASLPQGQADIWLPSIKGDVKAPDVNFQLPSAEVDLPTVQVGLRLPTGAGGLGDVGSTAREAVPPTGEDLPAPHICGSGAAGPDLPVLQTCPSSELREVSSASMAVDGRRSSADPQLPCDWPGDAVTTPIDSPERPVPVGDSRTDSQDSWFQMPSFRLPGLRRGSSKGPAGSGVQGEAQGPLPAEVTARAGDGPASAAARSQGVCTVGCQPAPEAAAEKASYADVLWRPADSTGLPERLPPAGMSAAEVSAGEGPVLQLPPIPRCAGSPGLRGEPEEGVPLPKLRAPGITCPDPCPKPGVFVPEVRPMRGWDSHVDVVQWQESPGVRGASPPGAGAESPAQQPVNQDLPSDASGSSVRAQVQATWEWSPALPSPAHSPPAAGPCVVRGALIPTFPLQRPSYGFSLLKVKIPEPPPQAGLAMGPPDTGPGAAVQEATATDRPDPWEPLEVIACRPKETALPPPAPEGCPGLPGADSCSEEEPAKVLATPAGDSMGAAGAGAPRGRAASGRPAGLLRLWFPSMGFSSMEESGAASGGDDQGDPAAHAPPGPPKRQERGGWFRLPKLGFSTPSKKNKNTTEDAAGLAEPSSPEETITFFDAQECFSPEEEEEEEGGGGESDVPMVDSAARAELILLEGPCAPEARPTGP